MNDKVEQIIREKNLALFDNCGVAVCRVADAEKGFDLATEILYKLVDRKSVLYLSGGRTPKEFYARLANEEKLMPGAAGDM